MSSMHATAADVVPPRDADDRPLAAVERFVWRPVEAPPQLPDREALRGRTVVVLGGSEPIADRLMGVLRARGATVHRFTGEDGLSEEAAADFRRRAGRIDCAIDLNLDAPFDPADRDGWKRALRSSVHLLKSVYEEWATEADALRIAYLVVTRLGGRMGYAGEVIPQPLGGIWAGLAKTLPREIPNANVRVLDLPAPEPGDEERIVDELERVGGLIEIGRYDGCRYTLASVREPVGPAEVVLTADDTILISGGGRGIGLAFAAALAREHGCRVVVTGRTPAPDPRDPLIAMDEASFRDYRLDYLRRPPDGRSIVEARHELARLVRLRELAANLRRLQELDLPVEYRVCDFASREEVRALIASLDGEVTGVVHNAGIDAPVRLRSKSFDGFLATVRVKVDGFLNLLEAVRLDRLKLFCNVGSLTGRWGGMVGQVDYAAANEGLTRLGFWAERSGLAPVKTLCWPTWERLGMVSNFEATLRYMAALDVEDGLRHWRAEVLARGAGEVTFMAPLGPALSPILLRGFPSVMEVPGMARLRTLGFSLGDVHEFSPGQRIRLRRRLDARSSPCLRDFTVAGAPAVPVSVLLDLGLAAARWIAPEDSPLQPHELRDVRVRLPALACLAAAREVEITAEGHWDGGGWRATLTFGTTDPDATRVAEAEFLYARCAPAAPAPPRWPAAAGDRPLALPAPGALRWSGDVFRFAAWQLSGTGDRLSWAEVSEPTPAELWASPHAGVSAFPLAALESLIRIALAPAPMDPPRGLHLARLRLSGPLPCRCRLRWMPSTASGWALDDDGAVALAVEGLRGEW